MEKEEQKERKREAEKDYNFIHLNELPITSNIDIDWSKINFKESIPKK